jgi:acyl-CoA reductase-like NAD-dependent aldehyde dehydrogenase
VKEIDAAGAAAAIAASNEAFRAWRKVPAPKRGKLVGLLGEELRSAKTARLRRALDGGAPIYSGRARVTRFRFARVCGLCPQGSTNR